METLVIISITVVVIATLSTLGAVLCIVWKIPDLPASEDPDQLCLPTLYPDGTVDVLTCRHSTYSLNHYLTTKSELVYDGILDEYNSSPEESGTDSPISLKMFLRTTKFDIKPAARLIGQAIPKDIEDNSPGLTPFTNWYPLRELHRHGGFRRFGVSVRNGRLVVPVAGLYDVYSFFVFYEPCKPESGEPDVKLGHLPLKHAMFKFDITEGHVTEIVHSVQPLKISVFRYLNTYTSYISSVVRLKAGDEVSVRVSNITYISRSGTNYMGVTLLH